jgi:tRNA A37 N6-isopentenylltransferase MiaA
MELLETQNPEKRRLIETSDRHKHELQKEVKAISDKTERIVKNALIIGGTLALTYLVVTQLSSSKKKRKKTKAKISEEEETDSALEEATASFSPPSLISQLGERLATQATALLLGIAKDKLGEYLSNRKQKDENS